MTAAVKNLIIEQNATFKKRITWKDKSKKPINLTGYGARLQIRDGAGSLLVDMSDSNGKIILGGATGTIDLLLVVAETRLLTNILMLYDLKLIAPDGSEDRKLQGKVTLSLGQTV